MILTIYLVVLHDFDNMENTLCKAQANTIVGWSMDPDMAQDWINQQSPVRFKGWDGVTYPYWTISEVSELPHEVHHQKVRQAGSR